MNLCNRSRSSSLAILAGFALFLAPAAGSAATASKGAPADPHAGHAPPRPAPGAARPAQSPVLVSWFAGGEGLFVPKYYDTFKDLDLTGLTAAQREQFLHRVNTEYCTCGQTGCRRDTIANCYATDASCPRAPVRIREILDSARGPAFGKTTPAAPAGEPGAPAPPVSTGSR